MRKRVQNIFSEVPHTYDLVNHILTLGMDIIWRKKAVRLAVQNVGNRWLDVCSGTGETTAYLARQAANGVRIYAADFSLPMLREAINKPEARAVHFTLADVKALPFPDDCFDLITISFATRNINVTRDDLIFGFIELRRVLKTGGKFVNLETSQPKSRIIRRFFHLYVKMFVKPIGYAVSGSKSAYAYLSNTILRFYPPEVLRRILIEAGYRDVEVHKMLFGVAAIHIGIK